MNEQSTNTEHEHAPLPPMIIGAGKIGQCRIAPERDEQTERATSAKKEE